MSVHVVIVGDPLDPRGWEHAEVEDARDFLMERFGTWPAGARVYDMEGFELVDRAAGAAMTNVLAARDVTPRDEDGVERLGRLPGPLLVAVSPADPITAIIAVVAIIVGVLAAVFLMPKIPDTNNQFQSPNNSLSNRTNTARPNARIPDIFGTVRSTPDLLSVPYRVYENHREVEIAYMCVGRGTYEVEDIRDGDTLVENIQGASVAVYGPGTSPNYGSPDIQIGSTIGDPVFNVIRLNEVNGQTMKAPNDTAVRADEEISFADGGIVQASGGAIDFTEFFQPGDQIEIGRAEDTGEVVDAEPVFGEGRGVAPDGFVFTSIDPSASFQAGQVILVSGAIFTAYDGTAPAGGSGITLDGGYANGEPIL